MQILKKTFSVFVTLTTIAWSVGIGTLALPGVASATSLLSGALIKASTPAVYYYGADGKRYVFPNEKTYKTWYADFSSVQIISDADLAAIQIGGNVTYKPGVRMVKITTDPKTYAVSAGGNLRWVSSEALAASLYGANWNSQIDDVPDAFFVNYSVGTTISMATDFSVAAATAKATSINVDKGLAAGGNNSSSSSTVTGSVSVSLASDTPAGMTITKNAASVPFFKFNLTAGSADAKVTGITVHRIGIGSTTDFSNVYLYDSNGTRLTTGRTINSQTNLVTVNSLNITIPAGTTKSLLIYGDMSTPASTGGQHAFEFVDATGITLNGGGTVSGTFPVRGNVFTVGTASSGRLDVQVGTTPGNPYIGSQDVEISNFKMVANTNDITVHRITLLQAGSITNTDLSKLNLYIVGNAATPIATTSALTSDGHIVLTFSPPYVIPNGLTKTFSLHAAVAGRSGRTIKTYVEYSTDVYATDNVYNTGAAVDISTNGSFDGTGTNFISVTTQGGQLTSTFNGPVSQNISKGSTDAVLFKFSLASPQNNLQIKKLYFTIAANGTAPLGYVKGASATEYFKNIKVKNLDTGATVMGPVSMPSTVANGANTTGLITMTDAFNMTPGQVLNLALTANLSNTEDSDHNFFTNGTSTYNVLWGSTATTLWNSTDIVIVDTGEYLTSNIVPNTQITGNTMTVKSSSLSVALAGSPSSATVVKKQSNVPTVGLVFTAGGQSDVTVTSIKLTGQANYTSGGTTYTAADLAKDVNACGLFDSTTGLQIGTSQSPDTTLGTMTMSGLSWTIPAGTSKTLLVKCTLGSLVNNAAGDKISVGIATASTDVTAQDASQNSITPTLTTGVTGNSNTTSPSVVMTMVNGGTLTVATDNLRASTVLVAGTGVWQNLAQFKATAQNEDVTIDKIAVTSTGDGANFTAIAIAQNGAIKGQDTLPAGSYQTKNIDLSANPITVPKNNSATFQIWAMLNNTQSSSSVNGATAGVARSGNTFALGIAQGITTGDTWNSAYNDQFDLRAFGAASGQRIYATSTNMTGGTVGNSFVLRRSVPTVTRQTLSSTTLAPGDLDLYKFQVSADPAGSISLKKIVFSLSTATSSGSSLALTNFRLRRGSSDLLSTDANIHNQFDGDLYAGTWVNATTTGKVIVAFTNEDTISGSGNVYTLHATVGGTVVTGDSVNISLMRTADPNVNTGYLTNTAFVNVAGTTPTMIAGPNLTTSSTAVGAANALGTFVWSDQSESPHYTNSTGSNVSRDWTDDVYLMDLTQTQILSR